MPSAAESTDHKTLIVLLAVSGVRNLPFGPNTAVPIFPSFVTSERQIPNQARLPVSILPELIIGGVQDP
jgi:hypothetical protein